MLLTTENTSQISAVLGSSNLALGCNRHLGVRSFEGQWGHLKNFTLTKRCFEMFKMYLYIRPYLDPHSGNFKILQLKYFLSYTIKECNLHFKTVFFKMLVKMKYRKLRCMANRINFMRSTLPFRRTALKKKFRGNT